MSTIYFIIAAISGFGLTVGTLLRFRKRGDLRPHQHALILSVGFFITWLASFFAPFFAPESRAPNNGAIIFGIALAISTGLMTYAIVYIVMTIMERKK